jgi:HlyD family type I secretion membrane fusion protein
MNLTDFALNAVGSARRVFAGHAEELPDRLPLPGRLIAWSWFGTLVGVVALVAWAAVAPLSGAVVAEGVIRTDGQRKVVQHQEGGIVKAILVKDGDTVKTGQPLLLLDNVRSAADLGALQVQLDAEDARVARLVSERNMADAPSYPLSLTSKHDDLRVAEILQRETTLFVVRRRVLIEQVSLLEMQLAQTRQEITVDAQLVQTAKRGHALSAEQLRTNEQLQSEGFVAETKVQDFRREEANSLTRVQSGAAELVRANQKRTELELKIASLRNDYVKTASDELKEATSRAFQLADAIRPARDLNARTQVLAPVSGVIVGSTVHTVGAVIGPRDTLMEVVPSGMPLMIEANIRPDDVRNIEVGRMAEVRLPAYNSRVTPLLKGTVVYIAPDALTDKDTRKAVYVVRVEVPAAALIAANRMAKKPMVLGPGLRAEVYVQTEARSAIEYLLDPIKDGIRKSMRD